MKQWTVQPRGVGVGAAPQLSGHSVGNLEGPFQQSQGQGLRGRRLAGPIQAA